MSKLRRKLKRLEQLFEETPEKAVLKRAKILYPSTRDRLERKIKGRASGGGFLKGRSCDLPKLF